VRLAEGVVEVAEATMAGALRVVSVERGYDPRDFVLLPFGGAGGLHACALAESLAIPRVLVPVHPGLLSAVGMVLSDAVRDYAHSVLRAAPIGDAELDELFAPLVRQADVEMAQEGVAREDLGISLSLDLRYRGQSFEVNVSRDGDYLAAFHARHEALYGYRDERREVEIVTLRVRAVGKESHPDLQHGLCRSGTVSPKAQAEVSLDGRLVTCPVYERDDLPCGGSFLGPALVVEATATHLVQRGWQATVDERGNLLLERTHH